MFRAVSCPEVARIFSSRWAMLVMPGPYCRSSSKKQHYFALRLARFQVALGDLHRGDWIGLNG